MSVASAPGGNAQPTGRVISITDMTSQDGTGAWVKGRSVTYQLTSGHTGTVFVPLSTFSVDAVRAAVQADAQKLADVANLSF